MRDDGKETYTNTSNKENILFTALAKSVPGALWANHGTANDDLSSNNMTIKKVLSGIRIHVVEVAGYDTLRVPLDKTFFTAKPMSFEVDFLYNQSGSEKPKPDELKNQINNGLANMNSQVAALKAMGFDLAATGLSQTFDDLEIDYPDYMAAIGHYLPGTKTG